MNPSTRAIAVRRPNGMHTRHIPLRVAHSRWHAPSEQNLNGDLEELRRRVLEEMAEAERVFGMVRDL
jgi:hypothetical protein